MITYKVMPDPNCKGCRGTGEKPYISSINYAKEWFLCDCIIEQLPEDADLKEPVEVVFNQDEVYLGDEE